MKAFLLTVRSAWLEVMHSNDYKPHTAALLQVHHKCFDDHKEMSRLPQIYTVKKDDEIYCELETVNSTASRSPH